LCREFQEKVLPLDKELERLVRDGTGLMEDPKKLQLCRECKEVFFSKSNRQIYCNSCAQEIRRRKDRERKRKKRAK